MMRNEVQHRAPGGMLKFPTLGNEIAFNTAAAVTDEHFRCLLPTPLRCPGSDGRHQ